MSIFGAIGSLVGGLFGNSAAKKRQTEMLRWQENMDNTKIQRLQKDAKAAGVHPLAAMGASLTSPSPVAVGGYPDFSDMGQNVGRAIDATMSAPEKVSNYTKAAQALTLDKMQLENDLIRTQLVNSAARTVNQAGNPPPFRAGTAGPLLQSAENRVLDVAGNEIKMAPGWSKAQDVEDEYADLVGNAYGVVKLLADVNHNYLSNLPTDRDLIRAIARKFRKGVDYHDARLRLRRMPRNFHP